MNGRDIEARGDVVVGRETLSRRKTASLAHLDQLGATPEVTALSMRPGHAVMSR
jgi:hypothetical protein